MNRIRLTDLPNQYPSIEDYGKHTDDTIKLEGVYPEKNTIYFKIKPIGSISLDNITVVEGTSFRFILAITNGDSMATNAKLFTSPGFKNDIKASIEENCPYFIRDALKYPFIVHYSLTNSRKLIANLSSGKLPNGKDQVDSDDKIVPGNAFVTMTKYNFISNTGVVDYGKLVKYIDWVVSTPVVLSELDTNNVLPIEKIIASGDYSKTSFSVPSLPPISNGDSDMSYQPGTGGGTGAGTGNGTGTGTGGGNIGQTGGGNPLAGGTGESSGNSGSGRDLTPDTGVGPKGYQL